MVDDIAEEIHKRALESGFDGCGIIPVKPYIEEYKTQFQERLNKIPESKPFYDNFSDKFINVPKLYPWAKSLIICTVYYGKYKFPKELQGKYAKAFLLSVDTVPNSKEHKKKIEFENWLTSKGIKFIGGEEGVPSRIMPLRLAAVKAGLGIIRKNNFFYGEKGSWYALEGYLIDMECEYINECNLKPCSEKCPICQNSCKTKALCAPYAMNPLSCISFWTTFGGGNIPPHLKEEDFENWICGCDMCQDKCPHNKHNWEEGEDFEGLNDIIELMQPENILKAADEELIEKVIPKTEFHILPKDVNILRVNAKRVCERNKNSKV